MASLSVCEWHSMMEPALQLLSSLLVPATTGGVSPGNVASSGGTCPWLTSQALKCGILTRMNGRPFALGNSCARRASSPGEIVSDAPVIVATPPETVRLTTVPEGLALHKALGSS